MHGAITIKSDYEMNWIDFNTEIPLQWTPKFETEAVTNHALYKVLYGIRGHGLVA